MLLAVLGMAGMPHAARAAALFFHPQDRFTIEVGEVKDIDVFLDTEGEAVNALDVAVRVPPSLLEIRAVSRAGSVLGAWVVPPAVDPVAGVIHFTGGIPRGGVATAGLLIRITVLGRTPGMDAISWSEGIQILRHDEAATPLDVTTLETPVLVQPATDAPRVTSPTHPDEAAWYRETEVVLSWPFEATEAYSYVFTEDPRALPDEIPDTPEGELLFLGSLRYTGLAEGISYFHVRRASRIANGLYVWGSTRTFRIQVDRTPPAVPFAALGSDVSVAEGKTFLAFAATDERSGVERVSIREPNGTWVEQVSSPYVLTNEMPGPITVRARDRAGNVTETMVVLPKIFWTRAEAISTALIALVLGCIAVLLWWVFSRRLRVH